MTIRTTEDVKIPAKLIDQVIGQKRAVDIIKKAARQRRNVLLIGTPGTGKTMLAQAMAELLPATELEDVLVYKNFNDENVPLVKAVKTYPPGSDMKGPGQGRQILQKERSKRMQQMAGNTSYMSIAVFIIVAALVGLAVFGYVQGENIILLSAIILGFMMMAAVMMLVGGLGKRVGMMPGMGPSNDTGEPKVIVDNTGMDHAPFIDATGSKAGALFGDVRHDPLQSGGLGTPAHLRVESGAVHKSNKGVLYIDEIASLEPRAQQELLTSMQEKKCSITGQSEMSSGALVKTEPAPCDFVLIAAGNLQDIQKMHPALRSRIRGYGYEVFMESTMDDNEKNRDLTIQFIAQEIKKDGKIPPFDKSAIDEIINEARRRAGRKNKLTLILRDLGGIIRAAGDLAVESNKKIVTKDDVIRARSLSASIESQIVSRELEYRKDYSVINVHGFSVGKVNGLAVVGNDVTNSGVVIPIVAEVTPAGSRSEGKFIPTGKLGKIATEAVKNVSAIIKKHMGRDIANYDMHVQFVQMDGVEGDSASISVAVSIISAMENVPIDQSVAMTGSLSVRGEVLPVGGVTSKVEAAIDAGIKKIIIPASNINDIALNKEKLKKVKIYPVHVLADVLKYSLKECKRKKEIIAELKKGSRQQGGSK